VRTLQNEERDDYVQVWAVIRANAADSFEAELAKAKTAKDVLKVYFRRRYRCGKELRDAA
jgi:hypothetical protein